MTDRRHDPDAPAPSTRVADLGYAPMDRIHAEFDEMLASIGQAQPANWVEFLERLDAHLRAHFAAEDQWMRETGFPAADCHIEEHTAVLKSSTEVLALAHAGNTTPAPSFVAELGRWFPGHADYLDSALAAWMCKRQYGGKPVVVHRARAERSA